MKKPTLPDALVEKMRERFAALKVLRHLIEKVDFDRMAVVTFSGTALEALRFYSKEIQAARTVPNFLLVDHHLLDSGEIQKIKKISIQYGVNILPLEEYLFYGGTELCVYTHPDASDWWAEQRYGYMVQVLNHLEIWSFGVESAVLHAIPLHPMYDPEVAREYFERHMKDAAIVYYALADEESRDIFLRALKARISGNAGYVRVSEYGEYHHPLVGTALGDVVCDGGLLEGHSAQWHALKAGPQGKVYAFDPEPSIADAARFNLQAIPMVTVETLGLWSHETELHIENASSVSRMQKMQNDKTGVCKTVSLDAYLEDKENNCNIISLDVEGAELEVLQGAMGTIRKYRPKLQISLYHSIDHYFKIPLMLMKERLGYKFYIGHHSPRFGETVLYANVDPHYDARAVMMMTHAFYLAAWKRIQPDVGIYVRNIARLLAGCEVIFWGAGAAYEYYKSLFQSSHPKAIVVDEKWIVNNNIDGIPFITFKQLAESDKALPLVIFSRIENSHSILNSIRKQYSPLMPKIFSCIFFG